MLRLAQRLEKGAANAYIGVIPSFGDRALAQVSARLAADEVMHWTVLSQALKDPLELPEHQERLDLLEHRGRQGDRARPEHRGRQVRLGHLDCQAPPKRPLPTPSRAVS